jgi:hypothetical protein
VFQGSFHQFYAVLLALFLLSVFYQDTKYRAVWWGNLAGLFLFLLLYQLKYETIKELGSYFIINAGFLALVLLLLACYFRLRYRKWNLFSRYLGTGDAIFLAIVGLKLKLPQYIIFIIAANLAILILVIFRKQLRQDNSLIPYAGFMALFFIVWIILFDYVKIGFPGLQ